MPRVAFALDELRSVLELCAFPLPCADARRGRETANELADQLLDYIIPRYQSLDAPLVAVVGGSTGSGKSLLVNSLVRDEVARSTAIRPTTLRPLLVHSPPDVNWFDSSRILPGLARVTRSDGFLSEDEGAHSELELASRTSLPPGLALLDSPDIDSVVEGNRKLAIQLLGAADLWVFVTTAARYSDAIPWDLLGEAAKRNIVLAVVLNRVPPGVEKEIVPDLKQKLGSGGLGDAPIFVIPEYIGTDGLIPAQSMAPLETWLGRLTSDASSRAEVARRTLRGATAALLDREDDVVLPLQSQQTAFLKMSTQVVQAFDGAQETVVEALQDGTLLRNEVVVRWQEVVGTGEWMARLEKGVASLRDRVASWFRGGAPSPSAVEDAIESSLQLLMVSSAEDAVSQTESDWLASDTSAHAVDLVSSRLRSHEQRSADAAVAIRQWQHKLVDLVSTSGRDKKATARVLAVGVNVVGAALMIVIFASTAGLTGAEVAVAGGTAVLAQKVLEAVFGDDAVRRLANTARSDLLEMTQEFFDQDAQAFNGVLSDLGVNEVAADHVSKRFAVARKALRGEDG